MSAIERDLVSHPKLFRIVGPASASEVADVLSELGFHGSVPDDLVRFWMNYGGGDVFETESILAPVSRSIADDDLRETNQFHWNRGMSRDYLLFHMRVVLSVIDLRNARVVALDAATFSEVQSHSTLDAWYVETLRKVYANRYRLD